MFKIILLNNCELSGHLITHKDQIISYLIQTNFTQKLLTLLSSPVISSGETESNISWRQQSQDALSGPCVPGTELGHCHNSGLYKEDNGLLISPGKEDESLDK